WKVLAARLFPRLFSYLAADSKPFHRVADVLFATSSRSLPPRDFFKTQMSGSPARLPTLREVDGVLGEFIHVDPERAVVRRERVIDQLKICAAGLAESLCLQ